MHPLLLGIDVGGTKLAGIAVRGASIVASRRQPRDGATLEEQVVRLARELQVEAGAPAAIGVAVPGQVDVASGVIELAVNLEIVRLPLASLLRSQLGVPCAVEHDARAVAGWLAARPGAPADLAYLSVGTGISAGVVIGGRLLQGAAGLAGEVGHLLADPAGVRCACGLIGCLETIASGPAVERAVRELDPDEAGARERASAAEVYAAAAAGDPVSRRVVERAAHHLAAAARGLALAYGVSRVVVGGGVTRAGPALAEPLRAALERDRAMSPLAARALPDEALEILDDRQPWGALGASAVALRALEPIGSGSEGEVGLR